MNAPVRKFEAHQATREGNSSPVLVGLMGPSGGGKTMSALRIATGMQQVTGGDIFCIDTEARRALHHADAFAFKHINFGAPFGSLDYLEALRYCVAQGAKVIIVDSMSHEHEGPGGLLDSHDAELDRMAGNDWQKRNAMTMLAWQKPKAARRQLINGLLQLNANFIFCFRAKNSVKPMKINNRTEMVPQGFMPIAGEEFVFEMTVNCLLLPGARGVPTWKSDNVGEKIMIKQARQFDDIFADQKPLDESIGSALASWAKGGSASPRTESPAAEKAAPAATPIDPAGAADGHSSEFIEGLDGMLATAAEGGTAKLKAAWDTVPNTARKILKAAMDKRHKPRAEAADKAAFPTS